MSSTVNGRLSETRIVIIGGSSGIGLATAKAAVKEGASVVIASRSKKKLEDARKEIGGEIEIHTLDIADEQAVKEFFGRIGTFDHLATPGCTASMGPIHALEIADARASFDSKFWGQYQAARYGSASIRAGGSIVLFSGTSSQRPPPSSGAVPAAMNSAVEGLGRALALELAPIRVNTVSPGLVDTPVYAAMPAERREAMFDTVARSLPVGRVGAADDAAQTTLYLMSNGFTTGSTLFVDGGRALR